MFLAAFAFRTDNCLWLKINQRVVKAVMVSNTEAQFDHFKLYLVCGTFKFRQKDTKIASGEEMIIRKKNASICKNRRTVSKALNLQ